MKKTLLCLLMIPLFANAKETLGVGEYRYGPDTTQNFACQAAEEKAKEHAITRYVGEQIESFAYETCQNESCDMQKNTFNEVKGEIKTIISKNVKTIENPGYTSCIVSVVADVHKIKNTINISLNEDFFNLRERDEVKFKGTSNRTGYLTVFNFYGGVYSKIYSVKIASQNNEFVIPSTHTNKIIAVLPHGQQQSKEMIMFLFTESVVDMKTSYSQNEMQSLVYSIPYQSRKVVNRYVNIVK